jgi:nitrate/TMAO reductase-like tetraheme cytochrome c subunit
MNDGPSAEPAKEGRGKGSIWRQPKSRWLLGVPLGGFLMFLFGVIAWIGFDTFVTVTNTESFCAEACHSMREYIKPEWAQSVHYQNRTGVRATCSDCHVPKAWGPKMVAKVLAVKDLYHEIMGTMSTREEFEERRLLMAERVWKQMRKTDSRQCRNCHDITHMAFDKQLSFQHNPIEEMGRTCIDCHKGIAHNLPRGDELTMKLD